MLSESSYMAALYTYIGSALAIMLILGWWLARHWRPGLVALAVLLSGALLLTPAYPREGVETFAPALIVAVFQYVTEGLEGARHALRPLAFTCALAVALALLLRLVFFRGPGKAAGRGQQKPAAAGAARKSRPAAG